VTVTPVLQTSQLSRSYGRLVALESVSVTVAAGECLALIATAVLTSLLAPD